VIVLDNSDLDVRSPEDVTSGIKDFGFARIGGVDPSKIQCRVSLGGKILIFTYFGSTFISFPHYLF